MAFRVGTVAPVPAAATDGGEQTCQHPVGIASAIQVVVYLFKPFYKGGGV
jgi:hypothetical protein